MPFRLLSFGCHFPTANVLIATIAGVRSHPHFVVMHFREERALYCNKFTTSTESTVYSSSNNNKSMAIIRQKVLLV